MLNRRQFLKGAALATSAAGAAGIAGVGLTGGWGKPGRGHDQIAVRDRLYRRDGFARVLVSRDQGASWSVHSTFAPRYGVERLHMDGAGRAWLAVRHENLRFRLRLSDDGLAWRTDA